MRRIVLLNIAWLLVGAAPGWAQETHSTAALENAGQRFPAFGESVKPGNQTDSLPEVEILVRKIKFVRAEEPYEMPLFRADPNLLEQRFIAEIVVAYAWDAVERQNPSISRLPGVHDSRIVGQSWYYPSRGHGQSLVFGGTRRIRPADSGEFFARIAERVPESLRDRERPLSFFDQAAAERYLEFVPDFSLPAGQQGLRSDKQGYFAFRLLAPTAERGEELTVQLLRLFDYGLSRPSMIEALKLKGLAEGKLAEIVSQSTESEKKMAVLNKQLETAAQVSSEDLVSLKTQQHLAEVDLAGVQARIDAAAETLARDDLPPRLFEPVETIKITAQIDLASLAARKKTLAEIIRKGTARKQLESDLAKAQVHEKTLRQRIRDYEHQIKAYSLAHKLVGPLRVHNNEVVIRPIRWRQPAVK